jgi:hypothetical protein
MNFKSLINDICCDGRIKDGVFDVKNQEHVFVLQEYLEKLGYDVNFVVDKTSNLFEAGRFPDRQAYNKDGILVTFPSKEYRDRAVNKGTHFAENPKKAQANIFTEPPADIKAGGDAKSDTSKEDDKEETVPIDQALDRKIVDTDQDKRTPKEKQLDALAIQSVLIGQTPLVNYSVDEAKRCGFYKKGFNWYDTEGNLIGEQVYDESRKTTVIKKSISESTALKYNKDLFKIAKDILFYEPVAGTDDAGKTIPPELYFQKVFETTNFDTFKFPRGRDVQFTFVDFDKYLSTNNVNLVPASTYVKIRSLSDERLIQYNKNDAQTIAVLSALYKKYKNKFVSKANSDMDKSCPAREMENYIGEEFNTPQGSKNAVAKKIADKLKTGKYKEISAPVKAIEILGSTGCKLSEEFAGISKISKTDLIINGNIKCSAKKAGGAQIASSQHKELTTVISAVLKDFPDIKNKIVANITQTLAQLMEKSFYYDHAAVINKNLTTLSTTNDQKKTKDAVNNLVSLIKSPDAVNEINIEEKEMHQMLGELNKIFTEDKYKKALLREFSTGEKRFAVGEKCVADHIMTWDCQGDCLIYTVNEFIDDNYNKIKFGVRDRGNERGGSLRIGILKEEYDETDYLLLENQIIEESLMSFINNLGAEFKNIVQNSSEFVKNLSASAKSALNVFYNKIKEFFKRMVIKISITVKQILDKGFEYFANYFDMEPEIDGKFEFEIP